MSFKSALRLDAKIFNASERRRAFRKVVSQSAKAHRRALQEKMIYGPHTGRVTTRGKSRGDGFTRRHQASREGERPAPDTNTLINSISSEMTGELSAKVEIEAEYGEILQKGGRLVMTETDVAEADKDFDTRARRALIDLL